MTQRISHSSASTSVNRRTGADRRKVDKGPPGGRERRVSLEPRQPDVIERELTPSEWATLQEQLPKPKEAVMPDADALAAFEAQARAAGHDEILERRWPANAVLETHTHDFDVIALVTEGEMWLTCGNTTRHLRAGDRFELARGVPHAERYGAAGAAYRAARRR